MTHTTGTARQDAADLAEGLLTHDDAELDRTFTILTLEKGSDLVERRTEEAAGSSGVPLVSYEDGEHVAVGVDGPPQVLLFSADLDKDLVQMPFVAGPGPTSAQAVRVALPELRALATDRFAGDDDAALEHQFHDLAEAEREAVVQSHAVGDDLHRVPVPLYDGGTEDTSETLPGTINSKIISGRSVNVTTPRTWLQWSCSYRQVAESAFME